MNKPFQPKRQTKNLVLIVVVVLVCSFAFGQDSSWSLQKCMEKALENNIEIKIRQLEVKRAQKARNSVWNQLLPSVQLYSDQSYNFGSTIDPSTNGRVSSNIQYDNFNLNTRMNLVDFGAFFSSQKEKMDIQKAKIEKEIIENEYQLQVLESYFQALFTQELLKIQMEQLQNAQFNLDRIQKEVDLGNKPKSDWYDMQLSFSQEEKRKMETEQLGIIQKTQLFQLMNETQTPVNKVVLMPFTSEKQAILEPKNVQNPRIELASLQHQLNKKTIAIQKAAVLPTLSAYYIVSSFFYKPIGASQINVIPFKDQLQNNKNQQFGLQLSLPIFNGLRSQNKIDAAKVEAQKSELGIALAHQKLNNELAIVSENKSQFLQLQQQLQTTLDRAKSSFITTQAKFSSGSIDAISFSLVKNAVIASEYDLLKNQLQLQFLALKMNLLQNNSL